MNTNQANLNEYITKDIYAATVLRVSGIPLVKVTNSYGKGIFTFKANPQIEGILRRYYNDELALNPNALFTMWKSLKSQVYSALGDVR